MMNLRQDLKGRNHGLIKVLSQHLPGGTEENHKELQSGYWQN
jgi:hypothetical protein